MEGGALEAEAVQLAGEESESMEFSAFFKAATREEKSQEGHDPYPFQTRLALSDELPELIDIPTGLGKTDAVVLGWLWRRRFAGPEVRSATPRRLVYCLPMRTLVEQTEKKAKMWLDNLGLLAKDGSGDSHTVEGWAADHGDTGNRIAVTVLMGGESKGDWDLYPERDAIIIGTQDMLLSRALNRGYGMSRYRWPVHFGLLNNDCLWVMDEVQLMGVGVETSAQMQAFCRSFGTMNRVLYIWMSATVGEKQLETVDHPRPAGGWAKHFLDEEEKKKPEVQKRFQAEKPLRKAEMKLSRDNEKKSYAKDMADLIISKHKKDSLTLAVVNRVDRAQEIFKELISQDRTERRTENDAAVLHSRFREGDRKARMQLLNEKQDRIIVATQVVEAGVDVSAHTLITELAPWPSLVQRFGRCNRRGKYDKDKDPAEIFWIDIDSSEEASDLVLPYESETLDIARNLIGTIQDSNASPEKLAQAAKSYAEPEAIRAVVRRKDFIDLFDTTSDLTGNDLDVSRFIREGEDKDLQVYWRDFSKEDGPKESLDSARREELCSVSIGKMKDYLKKHNAWIWDHLDERWKSVGDGEEVKGCRPGQVLLLHPENGGYSSILGWVGAEGKTATPVEVILAGEHRERDDHSMSEDRQSRIGAWVTLREHTDHVCNEVQALSKSLEIPEDGRAALQDAAIWHDVGKAHQAFQNMLLSGTEDDGSLKTGGPWAKSEGNSGRPSYWVESGDGTRIVRRYFRHELASALAWLQTQGRMAKDADLVAYLIAAHHGKIRMSIRSLDQENRPREPDRLFARGIWDGDILSKVEGILYQDLPLNLSIMQMGEGSWLERMTGLRDKEALGPLRLAFIESILRIADWRASGKEEKKMVV